MQYAFVLGRVFTLSLAELLQVLAQLKKEIKIVEASYEVLIVDTPEQLDTERLQKQLGGTIKILKIVDVLKKREQDSINFALKNYFKPSKIKTEFLKNKSGKIQFGVSVYLLDPEVQAFGEVKRVGMFIKRAMQDSGASIRLVLPEYNSLSLASVVVTKNLLLEKGAEICILAGKESVYTAKTLRVQDFEDYGRRDYQRPIRDERQGMIPPKVAQVMLNLVNANNGDTLLDPFCGIGTILQEGILLGFKMLGTDINKQAITGSEKNLEWFRNRYKISPGKYHLDAFDAREVSVVVDKLKLIGAFKEIKGIVSEGYLGPMYSEFPKMSDVEKNFTELQSLYEDSLKEFAKFLPSKARIVLCVPAYKKGRTDYVLFPSLDFVKNLGYNVVDIVPEKIAKTMPFLQITDRKTAIYDRKDQIVAREIVIFEKI
jgi:tRNA G10  N-methylase Trm11